MIVKNQEEPRRGRAFSLITPSVRTGGSTGEETSSTAARSPSKAGNVARFPRVGIPVSGEGSRSKDITEGDVAVARSLEGSAVPDKGQIEPFQRLPISKPEIAEAMQTLQTYKAHKANLEKRLVENQQWYKLRQWECLRKEKHKEGDVEPASAWLLNSIQNKHADAMDNFPSANILPREKGDEAEADKLTSILPVVLDQCRFEDTYSMVMDDKLQGGTGVYGVFWNSRALNGLGDIEISCVDLISLFWESGITDIQQSRNLFYVTLQDNDLLEQEYPQLKDKLSNPTMDVTLYTYDDTVDTNGKSCVVDWYYKKQQDGRTVLHYCKFVAGQTEPLFASENEPEYAERGWYDHGKYPFVFDPLMRCKGTPTGFGYIDVGKSAQEYIDRGDQAILQNLLFNARPRHFIRSDGSVNEEEFADVGKDFIHVDGNLGADSIIPVKTNPLSGIYVTILNNKVQELKETTGNRDVSNGGTSGGATAASAIAAMQEAGSKLSRDFNKGSFRAFREVILLCIELIRQFYSIPRQFRILGSNGKTVYTDYSNKGIREQSYLVNGEEAIRLPLFDIEVTAEKQSSYTKMAQNELALQLYGAGFFAPTNADSALACLDMMDFHGRDDVLNRVKANATLLQMLQETQQMALSLAQQVDAMRGTNLAVGLKQQMGAAGSVIRQMPGAVEDVELEGGEPSITRNARARVADSTAPR